jgi:hypothetical protein
VLTSASSRGCTGRRTRRASCIATSPANIFLGDARKGARLAHKADHIAPSRFGHRKHHVARRHPDIQITQPGTRHRAGHVTGAARGEGDRFRSDLFFPRCGVTMVGNQAFSGGTTAVIYDVLNRPPPIADLNPLVPGLGAVIATALEGSRSAASMRRISRRDETDPPRSRLGTLATSRTVILCRGR